MARDGLPRLTADRSATELSDGMRAGLRGIKATAMAGIGKGKGSSGNGSQRRAGETAWRIFLVLLGVSTLLRCVAAALLPLSGDEAYYWLWSHHLAPGYYDHPPMVAWVIALCRTLFGGSPLAARLGAVLSMLTVPLLLARLAEDMTRRKDVAALAGSLCLVAPYLVVEGGFITPNSPFLMFWCLALWLYHRALTQSVAPASETPRMSLWLLAGVALGLSCLSKLMALLMVPSLLLFLLLSPRHRALLKTPAPHLSLLAALAVFSPFLVWNASNGWESFRYQLFLRHLTPDAKYSGLIHFLMLQAATISPLLLVLCVAAVTYCWRAGLRDGNASRLYLACMASTTVLFFGAYSIFGQVELYWTLGGYLPAFVAASMFVLQDVETSSMLHWPRRLRMAVLILIVTPGILVTLLIYGAAVSPTVAVQVARLGSPANFRGNGVTEMYSYQQLGHDLLQAQAHLSPDAFVATDSYSLSSVLTFYSGRYVHTLPRNLQGQEWRRWENPNELMGHDALYIDRNPLSERADVKQLLQASFAHIDKDEARTYSLNEIPTARYFFVRCYDFCGEWRNESSVHLGSGR